MITFFESAKNSLPDNRKYWADYVFHFSDMKNIIKILELGKLYSRNKTLKEGLMQNDNASQDVINQTEDNIHDQVRFYFRPMTPTQYNNEGLIRENPKDAHCPRPVFLLFDNKIVEHHIGNSFISEKTLASSLSQNLITYNIEEINNYNYTKIYHSGSYDPVFEADIKQYRQAEYCINEEVDLSDLKYIITRSAAEKDMLLWWLHSKNINKYDSIIKSSSDVGFQMMFYRRNLYIENVDLTDEYAKINVMNYSNDYDFKIVVKCDNDDKRVFEYKLENQLFEVDFPPRSYLKEYKIKLVVDGEIMYVGEHFKAKKKDFIY